MTLWFMKYLTNVPLKQSVLCICLLCLLVLSWWHPVPLPPETLLCHVENEWKAPLSFQEGKSKLWMRNRERLGKWATVLCHSYTHFITPDMSWAVLKSSKEKTSLTLVSFSFSSRAAIILECFSGMAFFCLFLLSKKISKWFCLSMTLFFFNPKHF